MQPQKEIQPSKELEQEKPGLINVVRQPDTGTEESAPKIYSPDELDAAGKMAEQEANRLLANAELQEIQDKGIANPGSDNPWFHPTTNSGHLFDDVFFNHKLVQSPRHRLRRFILGVITVCALIGLIIYDQHYRNSQANKFNQQFPQLNSQSNKK